MNTFELNKVFGAVTAAFLVFLLAGFAAEQIYHVDAPKELAYALEIEEPDVGGPAEPEVDLAALLAAADPAAGATAFRKCSACHKLEDGANGVGPNLHQVVGRDVGSVDGFRYSGALNAAADVWGFEELNAFLTNPKAYAPGTSMGFAGIGKADERAALIVYLNQEGGSNLPLPEVSAAAEEPAAEEVAEAPAEAAEDVAAATDDVAEAEPAAAEAVTEDVTVEEVAPVEEPAVEVSPLQAALNAADPARGEALFATCTICHSTDEGAHGIGPSLHGIPGGNIAAAGFYPYSDAFRAVEGVWSIDRLDAYLADPSGFVGAQRVGFPGVTDQQDRADIIAFLNSKRAEPLSLDLDAAPVAEAAPTADEAPSAQTAADEAAPAEDEQIAAVDAAPAEEAAPAAVETAPAEDQAAEEAPAAEASVEEDVAVAEEAPAEEAAAEEPAPAAAAASDDPFAAAYAAASLQDGQRAFRKCAACHKLDDGANAVGPHLHAVVGRDIASVVGFNYSDALSGKGGAWDYESLNGWLENPRSWAAGNRMAFAGIRTLEERAAIIKYLNEEGGSNVPAP